MSTIRLPRKLEALPEKHEAVQGLLAQNLLQLWEGGTVKVPRVRFSAALANVLTQALGFKQLERGLENIDRILGVEKKGLVALQQTQGTPPANRVSRILLIANDGAERFNRACESTLLQHQDRVLGLMLDSDSSQIGVRMFGAEAIAKGLLVSDKEAAARVLLSLLE